ncbi:carbohydrate kinase family protein [Candidatus Nitrosocosmicus arcticus]|uniref:carbohydrate kinase family protein n=1 Tax=Candidatus Nitrosocosmicus arcticus TaxID=2035267 RepID=UPI00119F504D|nr:carbohydrate kinase family protein [Candidatus Nitrosocosmicus arcticus]
MNPCASISSSISSPSSSSSSSYHLLSCSSKSLGTFSSTGNDSFTRPNHNQYPHKQNTKQSDKIIKTENRRSLTNQIFGNSHTHNILRNLLVKLLDIRETRNQPQVTILPDFFVDRIIEVLDYPGFINNIGRKIDAGGGSMRGYSSVDIKGGNAINMAYSLAKLEVRVELFTMADEIGSAILRSIFLPFKTNVNLHIRKGKHGLSTVFEFSNSSNSSSNVMVSDVGDNDNFGPELIESQEVRMILRSSDAVIMTNWASNLRGTDLLDYVFTNSPKSVHFLDPADIEKRCFEFLNALKNRSNLIDFLSINENEYNLIIKALKSVIGYGDSTLLAFDSNLYPDNINAFCESAKLLSNFINLTVCIHTTKGSVISDGHESLFVDSIVPSKIDIVSGAGDSWDAGFVFGHLFGFTTMEKVCFANLLSSLHVGNLFGDNPSLSEIIDYIKSNYF